MLVQIGGQQPGSYVEIFVVVGGQPARVFLGFFQRTTRRRALVRRFAVRGDAAFSEHRPRDDGAERFRNVTERVQIRLRPDGQLDLAAARLHALEGLRQIFEANFLGDEIVGGNVAAPNGFERFANESRSVVKRRNQFDFRIVNCRRLDFHVRAAGQVR